MGTTPLLIYSVSSSLRDIEGDSTAAAGNDTIIVFDGVIVDEIAGDNDTNGGSAGHDKITLYGMAGTVYGDEMRADAADRGGHDEIDIYGTVKNSVIGDGIFTLTSNTDRGGDDIITIHKGATVKSVSGDTLLSNSLDSEGGSDTIVIEGTVQNHVYGDSLRAGLGGMDTIIVTRTGQVGISGTDSHIYGDYQSSIGGAATRGFVDHILIEGDVFGSIFGDYTSIMASGDDIVVARSGDVYGDVFW